MTTRARHHPTCARGRGRPPRWACQWCAPSFACGHVARPLAPKGARAGARDRPKPTPPHRDRACLVTAQLVRQCSQCLKRKHIPAISPNRLHLSVRRTLRRPASTTAGRTALWECLGTSLTSRRWEIIHHLTMDRTRTRKIAGNTSNGSARSMRPRWRRSILLTRGCRNFNNLEALGYGVCCQGMYTTPIHMNVMA